MTIKIYWKEGGEDRWTECDLPKGVVEYDVIQEHVRQLLKKAYKYSGTIPPTGMLKEGELL